jgi:phosphoglycolate phosphatase
MFIGASSFKLSCVLFDLDGTLLDTAPDILSSFEFALNSHNLNIPALDPIKPYISFGASVLIRASHPNLTESQHEDVLSTMLDYYQNHIADHTVFFADLDQSLSTIESVGLKWGVVTNKREQLTLPLMAAFDLTDRAACIISGDTTSKAKPHPEPMFEACKRAQVNPENCIFIGDAKHDIQAGNAANMKTLVAGYGYINDTDQPHTWGADGFITAPQQLTDWIQSCR